MSQPNLQLRAETRNPRIGYIPDLPVPEDRIVDVLRTAYSQARLVPKKPAGDNWKEKWQERLKQQSHCSVQDQFFLMRCTQFAGKARASANTGEIGASCQLFGLARSLGTSRELTQEGRLRCQMELAAAEAYLDYYCRDFEQAKKRLLDSMLAAQELEEVYGYTVLHVHRIHLLNNMVKVEARAGRLLRAMELAANIFLYLQGKIETIDVPASWGHKYSQWLTLEDRQFLSGQLIGEIAAATGLLSPLVLRDAFTLLLERVNVSEADPSWHPAGQAWLQLKILRVTGDNVLLYLRRCVPYIADGPGAGTFLWYLTAFDAAGACESVDRSGAKAFQTIVLSDLKQLKSLPRHVRTYVDRVLAQLSALPAA